MATPKLRFKEFGGDWNSIAIGNFLKIKSGLGFKAEEYTTEEEIRLLQIENVGYGVVKWTHNVKFVPSNYLDVHKDLVLKEGDLVLALNRPVTNDQLKIAKLTKEDSPSILYQRVGKLDFLKEDFDRDFIFQIFQKDVKSYVLNSSIGSDQPFISTTDLYKHKLSIPSKEEQTKIASFLSAVDKKIGQLNQKHELLSQYKQGMMQKLFSQQIRFKADDGSEFGEWEETNFSEQFKFHNTNSHSRALLAEHGKIMNIHYGDIHTKFSMLFDVTKESVPFLNDEVDTSKIAKEQFLKVGDLVIADASEDYKDIGKAIEVISLNNQKVVAGLHTYIARPMLPFALGFCGYMMQTFKVREQIKKLATGISVLGISKTNLGKVELSIPCLEEQIKIANFLSAIDQKIEKVAHQIEETKQWKKGLLQQMFV